DIIYHAAATTGQGIFQEAKALNETGSKDKVWVIGVDRDQNEDGKYTTKDGKDDNLTLASTIKGVNIAVKKISDLALEDKFPGGEHLTYGLKDGGVDLTTEALSDQAKTAVKEAKEQIISG
ncbi:BMP family ABC transporter substrate-binding protein, partial [Klebsiella pneumoniae]|nr:BMP family ABC transporter substrate-binding protein [Klebsiella pneumoniae]